MVKHLIPIMLALAATFCTLPVWGESIKQDKYIIRDKMKRIALITTLLAVLTLNTQARSHENNTPIGTWNASTEQITLNVEQDGTYSLYFAGRRHRSGKWRWATNGKYMVLIDNSISSELDFMSSHLYQVMVLKPCGKDKLFWSHSVKIVYRPLPKYKKGRKIYLYKVKPED